MRCGHCPQAIQNPEGGSERLPELYAKITKLSGITPVIVSLSNDVSDVLSEVERFKIRDIHELVVGSTSMPIDPLQLMEIVQHTSVAEKNLHLVHLHKSVPYDANLVDIIAPLFEVLVDSTVSTLQVAFNDNAMSIDRFLANKTRLLSSDDEFHAAFRSACRFKNVQSLQRFIRINGRESYDSAVSFDYKGRYFAFTRRIISFTNAETRNLDYYGKIASNNVDSGEIFSPNNLDLTITPFGVRIGHQTWDIENPYLWFTHDELDALMVGRDFIGLCNVLRASVNKTIALDLGSVFHGKMNTESLAAIAGMRKIA